MQSSSSSSSSAKEFVRKKRENISFEDHKEMKKICYENEFKFGDGGKWTNNNNDYTEGDSIFSELTVEELKKFNNQENDKTNNTHILDKDKINNQDQNKDYDDEDKDNYIDDFQCTQKFINDISNKIRNYQLKNNNFDISNNFMYDGSQYHFRDDILRNRTILNQIQNANNEIFAEDIQNIKNDSWSSQDFTIDTCELFPNKGSFYCLPDKVEKLIFEYKGINDLYEWQKECLTLPAIRRRKNLLYALPTSGGKTLVAEILMLREIICREKNVLFILPYVSIVQEKVGSLSPFALNLNFVVEEYAAGKGRCPPTKLRKRRALYIASIEKAAVLFDSLIEANRANEIGLVVVDELHLIGEKGRGATLESLLTKIMYLQAGIQIVGMSATIGNLPELSEFLDADVYTRGFRPVELKEFIKCGNDILEVDVKGKSVENIFVYRRSVDFKYSENALKADPDHIAGLISEIIPEESCLVFCSTRKNCENVAILLTKILPRKKYIEHKKNEKLQLMDAFEKLCGTLSPVLKQTIPFGIGYHHSGLTTDERKLLESAYRFGTICVICCTSTLAAGVNLPAKRVIIRAPYLGSQFMTLCQYKQMAGRAGRAGMGNDAGESILICSSRNNYQVGQMLFSPMDKIFSSMDYQDAIGLQSLVLSAIGLNLADCLRDLLKLSSLTLLSVQSKELEISIQTLVTDIIRTMFRHKILKVSSSSSKIKSQGDNDIITTQEIKNDDDKIMEQDKRKKCLVLSKSTKFELTRIGKAAFKAGIDYKKAQSVHDELKIAQKTLVISNYSHLLYLVVCFNLNSINDTTILPDATILFREYNQMDDDTRIVAKIVGITEAHAIKMVKTLSIKGPVEIQLYRLFKVMILNDVINLLPLHEIASKYGIDRGMVQNLVTQSISAANCIIRLCDEIEEFWCYKALFERVSYKLDHCCIPELAHLLDLPSVKIYRARQLYNAGFKTIEDIAKTNAKTLSQSIEHMTHRVAREIISAAKMMLVKKLEVLQEETEVIMNCLQRP